MPIMPPQLLDMLQQTVVQIYSLLYGTHLLTRANRSLSAALNVVNVTTWAPYRRRNDPVKTDFCFHQDLWCLEPFFFFFFFSHFGVVYHLCHFVTYKSIHEINLKGMPKEFLGCCFFIYWEKLVLWHQLL